MTDPTPPDSPEPMLTASAETIPQFISLGAGVQSSTMALMAAHGEITPMPQAAIFADTQSEPKRVYAWLDWLEDQLPFPVIRVTQGDLKDRIGPKRANGKFRIVDIPAFVKRADGTAGGLLNRSCTRDFKINPIRRTIREILGIKGKRITKLSSVSWIGISTDEASRMKPAREPWQLNRFPLIEKFMSRNACLAWMKDHGYPEPPKSSCVFCPFHNSEQWKSLSPREMQAAIEVDEALRVAPPEEYRLKGTLYLHRSLKPLREVDFSDPPLDFFQNECEGACGL